MVVLVEKYSRVMNAFILVLACVLYSTASYAEWHKKEAAVMGTSIRAEIWHGNPQQADVLLAWVVEEMHRVDRLMSPYKPESELAIINSQASIFRVIRLSKATPFRKLRAFKDRA